MPYVKYYWWSGEGTEDWSANKPLSVGYQASGMPSYHLTLDIGNIPFYSTSGCAIYSPRGLNIKAGDFIAFLLAYKLTGYTGIYLNSITVEYVDETDTVITSDTQSYSYNAPNNVIGAIFRVPVNASGFNIKVVLRNPTGNKSTAVLYIGNLAVIGAPDEIIHAVIQSVYEEQQTTSIPLNKIGAIAFARRLDALQNTTTYNEQLVYDGGTILDYHDKYIKVAKPTTSVDEIQITHQADQTYQVYYTVDHAVDLRDSDGYPAYFGIVRTYHNHNILNPQMLQFTGTLDGVSPYSETKATSLKFSNNGTFDLRLTPSASITQGDVTNITSFTMTIVVKDSGGNPIDSATLDVLTNTYDKQIVIDRSYSDQDLTLEITANAEGSVADTVTANLDILFEHVRTY